MKWKKDGLYGTSTESLIIKLLIVCVFLILLLILITPF